MKLVCWREFVRGENAIRYHVLINFDDLPKKPHLSIFTVVSTPKQLNLTNDFAPFWVHGAKFWPQLKKGLIHIERWIVEQGFPELIGNYYRFPGSKMRTVS